jgi:hypothetical protein
MREQPIQRAKTGGTCTPVLARWRKRDGAAVRDRHRPGGIGAPAATLSQPRGGATCPGAGHRSRHTASASSRPVGGRLYITVVQAGMACNGRPGGEGVLNHV